jgi:penicillin-binding protein 2
MIHRLIKTLKRYIGRSNKYPSKFEVAPDEIFLDATNLPEFNISQFEGHIEKPISKRVLTVAGISFAVVVAVFLFRLWDLQFVQGSVLAEISENNRLRHSLIVADRGVILDREGTELAWNSAGNQDDFSGRQYLPVEGLAHVLGYVNYPKRDDAGYFWRDEYEGIAGAEALFDETLSGNNGLQIVETDAEGQVLSENFIRNPVRGEDITLSIHSGLQSRLYKLLEEASRASSFVGGGGVIMDVHSGEVLALASYPEYDSNILTEGTSSESIAEFVGDARKPFLNRAVSGLYSPGSIVKPFLAVAALEEQTITPDKLILSSDAFIIPNRYFPDQPTVFHDWRPLGLVDMRKALAFSSNIYFLQVGGGFEDQEGLGIQRIEQYFNRFGFGEPTSLFPSVEVKGTVPTPRWKGEQFNGEAWLLGDTYNTSIGQYGFQVTPIQAVRAVAAIANGGTLVQPTLILNERGNKKDLHFRDENLQIVREGMRRAVTEGTALGAASNVVTLAAKSGTAEIGEVNRYINGWLIGFFPYEEPKYAFAFLLERGSANYQVGPAYITRNLLSWIAEVEPQLLE